MNLKDIVNKDTRNGRNNMNGNEMIGKKCPRCKKTIIDYPALSRKDNETFICSACGTAEAMEDFFGRKCLLWKHYKK